MRIVAAICSIACLSLSPLLQAKAASCSSLSKSKLSTCSKVSQAQIGPENARLGGDTSTVFTIPALGISIAGALNANFPSQIETEPRTALFRIITGLSPPRI